MEPLGIAATLTFGQLIKAAQLKVQMSGLFFSPVSRSFNTNRLGQKVKHLHK